MVRDEESLTERIARALRERVIDGRLPPGSPLRQDHVAREFGASHVPVREAFRLLEAEGLLTSELRKGVRVSTLEAGAVLELSAMRAALEALALRHAAGKLTIAEFSKAERAIAASAGSRSIAVWQAANRGFHDAILAPCGMPRLLGAIDDLQRAASRYLFAAWKQLAWQPRSDEEHAAILKCLKRGDDDRAARLLEKHILDAGRALAAKLGYTDQS